MCICGWLGYRPDLAELFGLWQLAVVSSVSKDERGTVYMPVLYVIRVLGYGIIAYRGTNNNIQDMR